MPDRVSAPCASSGSGDPAPEARLGSWAAPDGARYQYRTWGEGPPLVLLHGFTGSGESWADLTPVLARRYSVVAPDLLGHGGSDAPTDPDRYRAKCLVEDIRGLIAAVAARPVSILGYSMGARLALAMAVAHPRLVSRLVLESGNAGIPDEAGRAARRADDATLADRIEAAGVPAFVDAWERLPLWASQSGLPQATHERQRSIRLGQRAMGLANSLRGFGQGVQPPLWEALPRLATPTLLVAGALDEKYAALAERLVAAMPRAWLTVVAGAGHAPHVEQPEAFLAVVGAFLNEDGA